MERREIVRRAVEFGTPPRLPFWQAVLDDIPQDVCDCWEMDRAKKGWFFDHVGEDDWGCGWAVTEMKNMGQVVHHPLQDWAKLDSYRPPDPRDPFYFARIEEVLAGAADRYTVVTCHFNLIERLHMLHGFAQTLADFHLEPVKIEKLLDMILAFKMEILEELHRRFGDRVQAVFFTDDWGTQRGTFMSRKMFEDFFQKRYEQLVKCVHDCGWHFILHSCGKVNAFVPCFIDLGMDILNLQQPQTYGIEELGAQAAGKICLLTTADIQSTMPAGNPDRIRAEVRRLVENWSTPKGGFIVFNYGFGDMIGCTPEATALMFKEFEKYMYYWNTPNPHSQTC
ncbi:MAG: uroporphyrinogen decarboxylase family protein [Thermoguttaceae bacterium]|jgi:uroporphyrinogen-III decarboxylase